MTSGFPKASSIIKKGIEGSTDLYGIWFSLVSIVFFALFLFAIVLNLPNSPKAVEKIDYEKTNSINTTATL